VKKAKNWPALLEDWRRDADALAKEFAEGEARVEPKYDLKTCRTCDLQTLCRVFEKIEVLGETEGE